MRQRAFTDKPPLARPSGPRRIHIEIGETVEFGILIRSRRIPKSGAFRRLVLSAAKATGQREE
jgi:hypothetical protein